MKNLIYLALSVLFLCGTVLQANTQTTNGQNVKFVQYGPADNPTGSFVHRAGKKWLEKKAGQRKAVAKFKELNRDEWSVYLRDESRSMNIQLDLHTKKVMIEHDGKNDRRTLYNISKVTKKPNGHSTTSVLCTNGSKFNMANNGRWVEKNSAQEKVATFKEVNRDDWSVYLRDDSRSMNLQLDLHTMKIMISHDGKNDRRELYAIAKSVQ